MQLSQLHGFIIVDGYPTERNLSYFTTPTESPQEADTFTTEFPQRTSEIRTETAFPK